MSHDAPATSNLGAPAQYTSGTNTSHAVSIVCTASDAYRCFMRTHLDHLVIGPFMLAKTEQPAFNEEAWQNSIPLD